MSRKFCEHSARELRVPIYFVELLLLIEDQRFWNHGGIDVFAISRAFLANLKPYAVRQGGSTIPQQLYAIRSDAKERRYQRNILGKLKQAVFGLRISRNSTKHEILTEYVSTVYWGKTYHGLDAAALGYFGKYPSELNVGESFFLAERLACPNRLSLARVKRILARNSIRQSLNQYAYSTKDIESFYRTVGL